MVENIKYETCYLFTVPESLEDDRRLLVLEEDDIIFLLIVGTGEAHTGRCPVSVVCVRGDATDADTDTGPMLKEICPRGNNKVIIYFLIS